VGPCLCCYEVLGMKKASRFRLTGLVARCTAIVNSL
jgi:hypothetical protein